MKKKDLTSLRTKKISQLETMVAKKRVDYVRAAAEFKSGKKSKPKKIRTLRRDVAQILTVIREMEIVESNANIEEQSAKNKQQSIKQNKD